MASASLVILSSSRSCSDGVAASTAARRSAKARRSSNREAPATRPATTTSSGASDVSASSMPAMVLPDLTGAEEHLPLVSEVAVKGPLGYPGPLSDIGHGRLVVSALGEQLKRGYDEPPESVGFPPCHALILLDDRV
jgi:hypothetical protein